MRSTLLLAAGAATLALPLLSFSGPQPTLGGVMPELDAAKWYNSVPLAAADLQNKAVLVEVFRTW